MKSQRSNNSAKESTVPGNEVVASVDGVIDWPSEIKRAYYTGRASHIELGVTVYAARCKLGYGGWSKMWTEGEMVFCKRKGEMLALVGKQLGGLDAHDRAQVPPALKTACLLAKLPFHVLKELIRNETIHDRLTVKEAEELLKEQKLRRKGSPRRSNAERTLAKIQKSVDTIVSDWTFGDRALAVRRFKLFSGQLESGAVPQSPIHLLPPPAPVQETQQPQETPKINLTNAA
jgi:hypothetical protein